MSTTKNKTKSHLKQKTNKISRSSVFQNSKALLFVLAFAVVGISVLLSTYAAPAPSKGRKSTNGSISLVLLNSNDGLAHYGQQVTFNVSTTATDQPFVRLDCYENGVWALSSSAGFFDSYPWPWTRNFTLQWDNYHTAGASANCTATLYSQSQSRNSTLATTSFLVYP
ncbi:MAG: hypothetical protein V4702_01050 [Patescibacteria group bacterium]